MKNLLFSFLICFISIAIYFQDKTFRFQWWVLFFWLSSILVLTLPFLFRLLLTIKRWPSKNHKELILLILILLGAGLVRFYRLSEIPILGHDEARDAGLLPEAFLKGEIKDFFGQGIYGIPNLFFMLSSLPHILFPRTVLAIKFFAALFGVFSVLATYLLARKLFNREIAIISGVLLSFYHVHLHFSRSEFLSLFDSFWAPLLVWNLMLAREKNKRFSLLLGLVIGFSLHFYQGIRAIALMCFFYFFASLFFQKIKEILKKTFLFFLGLLIGLGPLLVNLFTRPQQVFNTGNAGKPIILTMTFSELMKVFPERILQVFGSIVYYPIDFHYNYGGPFLQFPANLFFLFGFVVILRKARLARYNFLLFWVASVLLINSAIPFNINFTHRLLSALPGLIIITSLGINFVVQKLKKPYLINLATIFLIITVAFINLKVYFFNQAWKRGTHINTKVATTAGFYIKDFKQTTPFYFLNSSRMSWKSIPSWEYLTEEYYVADVEENALNDFILSIKEKSGSKVFIILPERESDFSLIKKTFPGCYQRQFYFDNDFLFYSYECLSSFDRI